MTGPGRITVRTSLPVPDTGCSRRGPAGRCEFGTLFHRLHPRPPPIPAAAGTAARALPARRFPRLPEIAAPRSRRPGRRNRWHWPAAGEIAVASRRSGRRTPASRPGRCRHPPDRGIPAAWAMRAASLRSCTAGRDVLVGRGPAPMVDAGFQLPRDRPKCCWWLKLYFVVFDVDASAIRSPALTPPMMRPSW